MTRPDLTLGINTCFAVKRWPHPEEWAEIVRRELGLEMVQHSLDLVDLSAGEDERDRQATRVRDACSSAGIEVGSTFTGLEAYSRNLLLDPDPEARRRAFELLERAIGFSAAIGARQAGGHVGSLTASEFADPELSAPRWQGLQADLRSLAGLARRAGLDSLLIENMACEREPCRIEQLEALLDGGDDERTPIELCLDVGHQCVPGSGGDDADPYAWLARLGDRAPIVHLQQSDAQADHHWPFTPRYNRLGRIEPARVIEALSSARAEPAALVLEVIHPFEATDEQVLDELKTSVELWKSALAAGSESGERDG